MIHCLLWAIAAAVRPKVLLIADNLCLLQQLLVLQRRKPRPVLKATDRRFWLKLEGSSQYLCLEPSIMSISGRMMSWIKFLRPTSRFMPRLDQIFRLDGDPAQRRP
jgi:hypothetical protein